MRAAKIASGLLLALTLAACAEDSGAGPSDPDMTTDVGSDTVDVGVDAAPDTVDDELALPDSFTVMVFAEAPDPVLWAAGDLVSYLDAMSLDATLSPIESPSIGDTVITCVPGEGLIVLLGDGLGEPAFESDETDQTWQVTEVRCESESDSSAAPGIVVNLAGGGLLGRQYAVYEWLHILGVRFFHPEQEHVPTEPDWPADPVAREHTPAFRYRSVSLHLTHPLELGDIFRSADATYLDEAINYIDWQIKNGASFGTEGIPADGYRTYGRDRGFPNSTGLSLYNQQQGASGVIDPDDPRPVEQQIADAIDERMPDDPDEWPDFFGFSFNPTEFTEIDDRDAVEQMTFIADYIAENYPGVQLQTTNHGTGGEPTDFYGVRYYDLPQFAPPNLGVKVHTLMFYDLFRPAPVYGNESFDFAYDFMVSEYQTRSIWHFPESAWWLTFDIAVPLYLPITIEARDRDIQGIAFMLEGGLDGHRVFGSGHEWGYWQNEYCSFRMSADLDYRFTDCLADIASPMGAAAAEVQAVLERAIELQERDIIYGDVLPYLVGSDPETEVAASIGIVFHPLPPSPSSILGWSLEEVERWQDGIAPALERMDADYAALVARLDAVDELVPDGGEPWLDEIRDGLEVTGLRARHGREVYGALVTLRESQLRFDGGLADEADDLLEAAEATTAAALEVIERREAGYRYAPVDRSIGGGESGEEDENWTIYPYRYLNRTHRAYYYTRIDQLAREAFEGSGAVVEIADALLSGDETLELTVTDAGLTDIAVDFGDETSADGATHSHDYASPGVYTVEVTADRDGSPFTFVADVAELETEYSTGFTASIVEPEGAALIEGVLPGITFGPVDEGTVAIGYDVTGDGSVPAGLWEAIDAADSEAPFQNAPTRTVVPIVNRSTSAIMTSIIVEQTVVVLTEATDEEPATATLTGELSTDAVVGAILAIGGGFDEEGARRIVASTLGYTPDTLPEFVAFEVRFEIAEDVTD